jgi:hypothetical protein
MGVAKNGCHRKCVLSKMVVVIESECHQKWVSLKRGVIKNASHGKRVSSKQVLIKNESHQKWVLIKNESSQKRVSSKMSLWRSRENKPQGDLWQTGVGLGGLCLDWRLGPGGVRLSLKYFETRGSNKSDCSKILVHKKSIVITFVIAKLKMWFSV